MSGSDARLGLPEVVFQTGDPTLGIPKIWAYGGEPAPPAVAAAARPDSVLLLHLGFEIEALQQQLLLLDLRVRQLETPWYRRLWAWLRPYLVVIFGRLDG